MEQHVELTPAAQVELVQPSRGWAGAMATGPVPGTRITASYAELVARDAYFWAWPLVNMYNRRQQAAKVPQTILRGAAPVAPLNQIGMLTDYIAPEQRSVACPNQDVVYGAGMLGLDQTPIVVQVPDFGDRFWVYQLVDLRTDSIGGLGKMYGTRPGFYLIVGPDWKGEVPPGIADVFRSPGNTAYLIPRVFLDDTAEDRSAVQAVLRQITVYPLADYDGTMKLVDWSAIPKLPPDTRSSGEVQWVKPESFFDALPAALADIGPLPGEEARFAQVYSVIEAGRRDPAIRKAMDEAAVKAERELVEPLFQFRNYGLPLSHHWTTTGNNARFGTDYYTRTAVAKSNIFVNAPNETKYFYQDLDSSGQRLDGARAYRITFARGQTPPVDGFWSITLYDSTHFFVPNELNRYSLGTKNRTLQLNADGSLTILVQSRPPAGAARDNWLPAPEKGAFSLYIRAYWPKVAITDGSWTPPAVERID
ncbi:DUF1254 domain-containing protein [Sandaracinobacter sp. RS1-74]|uniref:DUF1254 domain-containing protein n=1 Tax=Sandaracinobacteroides sayramensis TaxID=2913411 RepID=UPI001EDBCD50|nr:DUF1254 domain-containing protein [Sandaracinobacteroides sayramensis]MCG2842047.1 DUF1254 domain-containing protein [Sandaracinobacteroides sayramensis]